MILSFKRHEASDEKGYVIYGKSPRHADFIRVNAEHPALLELDRLLQAAVEDSCSDSLSRYAAPCWFQFATADRRHALLGVLAPSVDQAGRRYPLLAALTLPAPIVAGMACISSVALEIFAAGLLQQFEQGSGQGIAAAPAFDVFACRQYLESSLQAADTLGDAVLAESVLARYMESTSTRYFGGLLDDHIGSRDALAQALLNLLFYRAFLRRFPGQEAHQSIMLPLPPDRGEQVLAASAWLRLLEAIRQGNDDDLPWLATFLIKQESSSRFLLMTGFHGADRRLLAQALQPALNDAHRLDLGSRQEAWCRHPLYAEVAYALDRLLADPACSLKRLAWFLADVSAKLDDRLDA
ncbi:type VI secretion system protein ImpM [Noviherbaspirillum humi]|uniref:Type VI secretion system protein ImpM n=1 Tax=Noviherbaspirillum humi TaxID=1688639 RepID=A0A239DJD7_9BURK|nr:type VI secretion system-associated protein TagF [Noviherbaspirillum humi]SNS32517.1 type VI secretion system protein ImpM [Noviherbaspirillum humi]